MPICRNCGKEVAWVDDEGYCKDCLDEEDEEDSEGMTSEEMDDFATMIINSPFNPGI